MDDDVAQLPRHTLALGDDCLTCSCVTLCFKRGSLLFEPLDKPQAAAHQAADEHRGTSHENRIPGNSAHYRNRRLGQQKVDCNRHRGGQNKACSQLKVVRVSTE